MTSNKTVLITGGGIGLGRELAIRYAAKGWTTIICGRTQSALDEFSREFPEAVAICVDLADPGGRRELVEQAFALNRPLDLLIHNAALQFEYDFAGACTALEKVETELNVNLLAPVELSIELLPLLKKSHDPRIAFVSSALARVPKKTAPVYCASKSGLSNFARALRYQLEGTSIAVTEILPDLIRTRMTGGRAQNAMEPADVASEIIFRLARGDDKIMLGRVKYLYALHRLLPSVAYRILKAA